MLDARLSAAAELNLPVDNLTVDSPIPYKLGNPVGLDDFGKDQDGQLYEEGLVGAINKQRPNNQNRANHEDYNKVLRKLDSLMKDERVSFMMEPWDADADPVQEILGQFMDPQDRLLVVDLSGAPNEIAGTASAALVRTLFSMKVWQTREERAVSPLLIVCEEAHRYIPNSGEAQYEAAQDAIRRVAKEGRKYGVGLFLNQSQGEMRRRMG